MLKSTTVPDARTIVDRGRHKNLEFVAASGRAVLATAWAELAFIRPVSLVHSNIQRMLTQLFSKASVGRKLPRD